MIAHPRFPADAQRPNGHSSGWQVVLADLALILFLVTLAALAAGPEGDDRSRIAKPEIAASQALYREVEDGPTLAQWLDQRPADPRATLTILGQHTGGDDAMIWDRAEAMARQARGRGFRVRVVIGEGEVSDLYASLAYDELN